MHEVQTDNAARMPSIPFYIVTTRTGRQGKAHIPGENGGTVCGKHGKGLKRVDAETVEKFYSKCERCLKER